MSLRFPVSSKDHSQGSANATITLVEYGDYECPYCLDAFFEIKKIQAQLKDKLNFVFRNFPLYNIHPHALQAAIAAEVASEMGKYWEMHDMLYQNQDKLSDDDLIGYAQKLELDVNAFEEAFSEQKYVQEIEDEIEGGLRSGVNGTPSFFINGLKYNGEPSAEAIIAYIHSL